MVPIEIKLFDAPKMAMLFGFAILNKGLSLMDLIILNGYR